MKFHFSANCFQGFFHGFEVAVGRGPARYETAESVVCVYRLPCLKEDVFKNVLHLLVGKLDELLVGAGVAKGNACIFKQLSHLHGHVDGMLGDVEVKVVRK